MCYIGCNNPKEQLTIMPWNMPFNKPILYKWIPPASCFWRVSKDKNDLILSPLPINSLADQKR